MNLELLIGNRAKQNNQTARTCLFEFPEGYFRGGSAFPLESKDEPVKGK